MNKRLTLLITFGSLIISTCSERIYSDNQRIENTGNDKLENLALNRTGGGSRSICCNNDFPPYDDSDPNAGNCSTFKWCNGDSDGYINCNDCAKLWSNYNHDIGNDLLFQACGGEVPDIPVGPSWILGSNVNGSPKINWGFVYSHKYKVELKIGDGSWNSLIEFNNCYQSENMCQQDSSYIHSSIDLSTISVNYYYRVKSNIYNAYSNPTNSVVFKSPINVDISGPNQITTIQWGSFNTSVTGGLPVYNYEWWKFQECVEEGRGSKGNNQRAPQCGRWVKLVGTGSSINVSGSVPGFRLKVKVTDGESDTDFDYHSVSVIVP